MSIMFSDWSKLLLKECIYVDVSMLYGTILNLYIPVSEGFLNTKECGVVINSGADE